MLPIAGWVLLVVGVVITVGASTLNVVRRPVERSILRSLVGGSGWTDRYVHWYIVGMGLVIAGTAVLIRV